MLVISMWLLLDIDFSFLVGSIFIVFRFVCRNWVG